MSNKLSIITINYNNSQGLESTINSVVDQSFSDFEFIIVDGKSTDDSELVINKYKSNIDSFICEPDNGIYDAMNKAIRVASGEYLLFLNSGDYFISEDTLFSLFKEDIKTDFIFGAVRKEFGYRIVPPNKITMYSLIFDLFSHQASFIKRTLFEDLGLYDTKVPIVADWKFAFLALTKFHKTATVVNLDIAFCDSKGVSSTKIGANKSVEEKYKIIKDNFPLIFDDYIRYHNFRRLSFVKIYNGLKRRIFNLCVR